MAIARPAVAMAQNWANGAVVSVNGAVAMAQEWVYRVCPQEEWASAQATGALQGGALDTSSGFIHLSTAAQVQ